jgi:hypothetical protein
MRATCLATQLSAEQRTEAGVERNPKYNMTKGKEYLVLGLRFITKSDVYGASTLFEVEDDSGLCVSTPSVLFEITDPRPSMSWIARQTKIGFKLWPEEFYAEYFHEDVSDRRPEALRALDAVKRRLDVEKW